MSAVGKTLLTLATTTVGLTAGVMFDWQLAIMPGLGELSDREFVSAFQAFDRSITNPLVIGGAFMGGAVFLVASAAAHRRERGRFRLLAAASAIYVVGVLGVTMGGNVPLNEKLAEVSVASASDAELASARSDLEGPWNALHLVRTGTSVASLVLLGLAMLTRDEKFASRASVGAGSYGAGR